MVDGFLQQRCPSPTPWKPQILATRVGVCCNGRQSIKLQTVSLLEEVSTAKREKRRRELIHDSDKEDMGSSPPRQSEIRVRLKGGFNDQLRTVLDAFEFFEFASIPPNVLEVIEVSLLSLSSPCFSLLVVLLPRFSSVFLLIYRS